MSQTAKSLDEEKLKIAVREWLIIATTIEVERREREIEGKYRDYEELMIKSDSFKQYFLLLVDRESSLALCERLFHLFA